MPDRKLELLELARDNFLNDKLKSTSYLDLRVCKNCNKNFQEKQWNQIFCSETCVHLYARKAVRPTKEELQKMIDDETSWVEIGKNFGVTDNAVKKWAKGYQIQIPKRQSDRIEERACNCCEKIYKPLSNKQKYCSHRCVTLSSRKVLRPSKEELVELLKENTYAQLGERFKVRWNTVRKWTIAYGIVRSEIKLLIDQSEKV